MLSVKRSDIHKSIEIDPAGTIDGEPARAIRVCVDVAIPHPDHSEPRPVSILQRISSPGLYGIPDTEEAIREACGPDEYWTGCWQEEHRLLEHMLTALGVTIEEH